ncbi:dihydroorotase [Nesterenkonia ebinurensis]|uniref:dihydroorotase n=1 Tax=Nesterenkonia ebinurensis TaxID=2608252 RepID=UPI00123E0739|nr:dihydroorotase family protein [Nesterenkonia ebinurensis]
MTVIIRGARLFDHAAAGPVDLMIQGEIIVGITSAGAVEVPGAEVRDATGLLALPGLIDIHTHIHPAPSDTADQVGQMAPLGGVTTSGLMIYPDPGESFGDAVRRVEALAVKGASDFCAHLRIEADRATEDFTPLAEIGATAVKLFMAHGAPGIQSGLKELTVAAARCATLDIPVLVHAELGDVVDGMLQEGIVSMDENLTWDDISFLRSPEVEAAAIDAVAAVGRATGARMYIVHVSCEAALEAALRARRSGTQILIETCPHYLTLTDEDARRLGGYGRVLPPLRQPRDVQALRAAVQQGLVDTVASDHCGHSDQAKHVDDLVGSAAGLPGGQDLGPLMIDAALGEDSWLKPQDVTKVLASGPAEVFQLPGKGRLLPGYDADVTLIDPAATTTVSAATTHTASPYNPWEGWQLRGAVHQVLRRGELIVDSGRLQAAGGQLIRKA